MRTTPLQRGIRFLGYYKNGLTTGKFWAGMIGGSKSYSFLHESTHPLDGTISGSNISYIYPDMETAFLGTFEGGVMKDSQESSVIDV